MEGIKDIYRFPPIAIAKVTGYDPVKHAVYLRLPSGQDIAESVRVGIIGSADGLRINQEPLPLVDTWGLIAVPNGDIRAAIWLCGLYPAAQDAITTSNPPTPDDSQLKYYSHWSGAYWLLDAQGQAYFRLPDGTNIIFNSTNTPPVTYRHVISGNSQKQIVVADTDRTSNVPNPFYFSLNHPTGTTVEINPQGAFIIQSGNNTGTVFEIDQNGNISITGSAQASYILNFPGGIELSSQTLVELIASFGGQTGEILVSPGQILASPPITNMIAPSLGSVT